jgi:hypothetical protein
MAMPVWAAGLTKRSRTISPLWRSTSDALVREPDIFRRDPL